MEDTLRYFYSAVFQGFAAIVTLGSMFYLYFSQNLNTKIKNLEDRMYNICVKHWDPIKINKKGIIEFLEDEFKENKGIKKLEQVDFLHKLYDDRKSLEKKGQDLRSDIPRVLLISFIILITSLISLFLLGYNCLLNKILIRVGILIIGLSAYYLIIIKKFIFKILDI